MKAKGIKTLNEIVSPVVEYINEYSDPDDVIIISKDKVQVMRNKHIIKFSLCNGTYNIEVDEKTMEVFELKSD
jgi:hypothetical protein